MSSDPDGRSAGPKDKDESPIKQPDRDLRATFGGDPWQPGGGAEFYRFDTPALPSAQGAPRGGWWSRLAGMLKGLFRL